MNARPILHLLFAVVLLAACTTPATAPTEAPAAPSEAELEAKVIDLINLVDAHANIPDPWEPASVGMSIFPGGEVWAKEASTARLGLGESTIRVAPNTIFTLNRPDDQTIQLDLSEGQIWLNIEGLQEGDSFEVETPGATASVRGTRFSVLVTEDGDTVVSVVEGDVALQTEAGQTLVGAGLFSIAPPGEMPSDPMPNFSKIQLLWANAGGPNLDMAIPFTGYQTCLEPFQGVISVPPVYSPDGSQVTFQHYDASVTPQQHLFNTITIADGSSSNQPPAFASSSTHEYAYNPAGNRVVFTKFDQGHKVCTADPDGQNAVCFDTAEAGKDFYYSYPKWSPDGQKVLFNAEYYKDKQSSVFAASPDGTNITRLTPPDSGYNTHAVWSPDGTQIAYMHADTQSLDVIYQVYEMQNNQLWLANSDGSQARMLADNIASIPALEWSPDSNWIAAPTPEGIGLFGPDGDKQTIPWEGGKGLHWSPSSTGWPLTYIASTKGTEDYSLNIVYDPKQAPVQLDGIYSGPYWSPGNDMAMVAQRETVNADEKVYNTTVCFLPLTPNFWP